MLTVIGYVRASASGIRGDSDVNLDHVHGIQALVAILNATPVVQNHSCFIAPLQSSQTAVMDMNMLPYTG